MGMGNQAMKRVTATNRILAAASIALGAWSMSATASHAFLGFNAGETVGTAFGAPLPEGIFAVDLESYGQRDIDANHNFQTILGPVPGGNGNASPGPGPNLNINIPDIVWSTPFSFYNTRLMFLYSAPVVSTIGGEHNGIPSALTNRTDVFNQALGPILAHSFGNGFSASVSAWVRPPAPFVGFINHTYADLRTGLSYTRDGYDLTVMLGYTGTFGGHQGGLSSSTQSTLLGNSDAVDIDFTATKKFGKFEIGVVGYAFTDINTRGDNSTILLSGQTVSLRGGAIAVGGLVGYDFGRFSVQAFALRQVASRNEEIVPGVGGFSNPETRGFLRVILPLYVAPAPPTASLLRAKF